MSIDFMRLRREEEGRAVSVSELSRYAAGELSEARRAEIEEALSSDDALKAELDELEAEKRAFQASMPFGRFVADHEARVDKSAPSIFAGLFRFRFAFGSLAAAACALAIFVAIPESRSLRGHSPEEQSRVIDGDPRDAWVQRNRTKGGASLGFVVKDGEQVRFGEDGEVLKEGAQIQFAVVDQPGARAMLIVGIDGKGVVSTYAQDTFVGREKGDARARLLDESLVLDDAVGAERFFVVFTGGTLAEAKAAVQTAARKMVKRKVALDEVERLPLDDARFSQSSIHIVKVR